MDKERQIVIVGVGRCTDRAKDLDNSAPPAKLLHRAARLAAADAGLPQTALHDVVLVATVDLFFDQRWQARFGGRPNVNMARTVADEIGARGVRDEHCWRSHHGGNGPQYLMNRVGELLRRAELPQGPVLIGGAEVNHSFDHLARAKLHKELPKRGWCDTDAFRKTVSKPVVVNKFDEDEIIPTIVHQLVHGLYTPINVYALLENVYRRACFGGTDKAAQEAHNRRVAELFAGFSAVAASHPEHSWFPRALSATEIAAPSPRNRMLAHPYRKNIVARDEVNQAACLLVMSWAEAERRGVPAEKLVFLVGSGEGTEPEVPVRKVLSRSQHMHAAYHEALRSAGIARAAPGSHLGPEGVDFYDIYSCFPVAVEHACDCLSIDPLRVPVDRITATGGLPYHGGPGSNYVSHSIAAVVEKIRAAAAAAVGGHGSSGAGVTAVVGANGGMLTKHAVGVYSARPPRAVYRRRDPAEYNTGLTDDLGLGAYTFEPCGVGRIVGWTVEYNARPNTPRRGIIVGEMLSCDAAAAAAVTAARAAAAEGDDDDEEEEGGGGGNASGGGCRVGQRFVATTDVGDSATVEWLLEQCRIGENVRVRTEEDLLQFGKYESTQCIFARLPAAGAARRASL